MVFHISAITVHIRGHHRQCRWHVVLQACDKVEKRICLATLRAGKDVLTSLNIQDRVVNVHCRSRFIRNRFRHECCITIVTQCSLTDQAFEVKYFVSQFHGITVQQIDLKLTSTAFLRDAINLETLRFCKVINVVDNRAKLINRSHRICLTCSRGATGTAHHWTNFLGWIYIAGHKEEFHFRGHDRLPAFVAVHFHNALQDVARREWNGLAVAIKGVMDHLKRPITGPRCCSCSGHVGAQNHVFFDEALIACGFTPSACNGLVKDTVWQMKRVLAHEFLGRHRFAARDAR